LAAEYSLKEGLMPKAIKVAGIGFLLALGIGLGWYITAKPNQPRPLGNPPPAPTASVSASDPVMRPYCFSCATPDDEKSCADRDPTKRYSVEIAPIGENRYACCSEGFIPTVVDADGGMLTASCKPAP
jgi:hypothetical protein